MAYRFEKNPETGNQELIIDGWENGIAASPYEGITSIKNLNIRYLPGAVYSNYKRILNTAATTVGSPTFWTQNPRTGVYFLIDSNGKVWTTSDPATIAWTEFTGNSGHYGQGQGIVVYKNFLFVFKSTSIDYCDLDNFNTWTFDWQTGIQNADHMAIWGQDDILYFCNGTPPSIAGSAIGSIAPADVTMAFQPASNCTYNPAALTLPGFERTAIWLSELGTDLIIAAGKRLYPWDRTSTNFNAVPVFIKENITRVFNIMNKLYVTAGVKGNIYISNGYSISPWIKIPDSFFGTIDPGLAFGDMMCHRNKLYVGVSMTQTPFTCGVFSIDLDTRVINYENQNSFGPVSSGGGALGQPNILIDLESAAYDNYASAWYDGSKGGMDTNSTTLYTDGETVIETDLINVGTFLYPKTNMNIEFKLDQPMTTGDTITISARQSFSGSYTQLGQTTAKAVLSDVYTPLSLEKSQWLQFKIVLDSSAGSFIRLREIRIR